MSSQWGNPAMTLPEYQVPRGKIQNLNPYAYDYDYDIGPPFGNGPGMTQPKNLEPPPREVEEAVETISNYLNNASQTDVGMDRQNQVCGDYLVVVLSVS